MSLTMAELEARAVTFARARGVLIAVVGFVTLVGFAFCAGRSAGASGERSKMADSVRQVLADSSKAMERRMEARAPAIVTASARVDTVRIAYRAAAARIVPVSDTTVSIDGGAPVSVVPASLVIPPLRLCAQLDTVTVLKDTLVAAQLVDMTKDRNSWRDRAHLDEAQRGSRFGFKSGVVIGAAIVGLIVHAVR